MRTVAIIPAAGSGSRTGSDMPKQFMKFNDRELIAYTLEVFQNSPLVDEMVIATSGTGLELIDSIRKREGFTKITKIVEGGKERQDSVFNALKAADMSFDDLAAVHDAARALLPPAVLDEAIRSAREKGSALVCMKARDTIGFLDNSGLDYIDRNKVYIVQTPQIFRYGELMDAFSKAYAESWYGTDESSLMRRAGYTVNISEGSALNFKVTTKEDLDIFSKLIPDGLPF